MFNFPFHHVTRTNHENTDTVYSPSIAPSTASTHQTFPSIASTPVNNVVNLGDITKTPYVEKLQQQYNNVLNERDQLQGLYSATNSQLIEMQKMFTNMAQQYGVLQEENRKIREDVTQTDVARWTSITDLKQRFSSGSGSASITPSESFSQAQRLSAANPNIPEPTLHQPLKRPPEYPESILWLFENCKSDPDVCISTSNMSRPKMSTAVRNIDGSMITKGEWTTILRSAHMVKADLLNLQPPRNQLGKDGPRTRKYFRSHFPAEWQAALDKLERLQPLLSLCSSHWKAEQVLGNILLRASESSGDTGDREDSEDDAAASPTNGKKRRRRLSSAANSKRRKGKEKIVDTPGSDGPPETETQISNTLHAAEFLEGAHPSPPASSSAIPARAEMVDEIDVSFINVSPSVDNLRDIFSREFPSITHAMDLVKSLQNGTCPGPGLPSSDVSAFLERIESADPNSAGLSEDETNGNWGHSQFTAGSMRCATVLQSWDQIGIATACKLLAAAIKTCRVARHVCFAREIEVGSYLSDAYLQTLVESLWTAREKAVRSVVGNNSQPSSTPVTKSTTGPTASCPSSAAPTIRDTESPALLPSIPAATTQASAPPINPTAPSPSTSKEPLPGIDHLRGMLQVLQKEELRGLLTCHGVATDSVPKARTKEDLIQAFLSLPTADQLSQATIDDIVIKRKGKKTASRTSTKAIVHPTASS